MFIFPSGLKMDKEESETTVSHGQKGFRKWVFLGRVGEKGALLSEHLFGFLWLP